MRWICTSIVSVGFVRWSLWLVRQFGHFVGLVLLSVSCGSCIDFGVLCLVYQVLIVVSCVFCLMSCGLCPVSCALSLVSHVVSHAVSTAFCFVSCVTCLVSRARLETAGPKRWRPPFQL